MANHNPGDVEFGDLDIEGTDVSQHFFSIVFKEHLLSPFVLGRVALNQYEGMAGNFDGSKKSSIVFGTPNGNKRRYDNMLVNNTSEMGIDDAQRSRNLMSELISKHAITSNFTPNFQKSFKNIQVSDMVNRVLSDGLGMEIPMNIDITKGLQGSDYQPIIMTQKSPLKHIEDLRRMAVSNENYDGFLTYSGIGESGGEEFFFKSVYDLIKGSSVGTLTNLSQYEMNSDLNSPLMNNVMEMYFNNSSNAMDKGHGFSVGTSKFDMHTAVGSVPDLKYGKQRQEYGSSTSLNPGQTSGYVTDPYNGMPGTGNIILEDSRRPDTTRAATAPYTESLFTDMKQKFLTVKIPGNSNYKVGNIIDFEMRENTDMFVNKDVSYWGKNMIVGMTNYVGPIGDRPRYVTYLDLINIQTYNGQVS